MFIVTFPSTINHQLSTINHNQGKRTFKQKVFLRMLGERDTAAVAEGIRNQGSGFRMKLLYSFGITKFALKNLS